MDYLKTNYGDRLGLIGNIDIDKTITHGTMLNVKREVRERINQLGTGGGYIISDSNSVPVFCKAENIIAMAKNVEKYRDIY